MPLKSAFFVAQMMDRRQVEVELIDLSRVDSEEVRRRYKLAREVSAQLEITWYEIYQY